MRARFGRRRRRGGSDEGQPAIEGRWLERVVESGVLRLQGLEARSFEGIPDSFALTGVGEGEAGERWVVGLSPTSGGDAVLAALVASARLAEDEGFSGQAAALAPHWSAADRRRLGAFTPRLPLRAHAIPGLAEGNAPVQAEPPAGPGVVPVSRVAAALARPAERVLFERALEGLRGLAAKHGGSVRGVGRSVELAILARRVAALRAADEGPLLETFEPARSRVALDPGNLADALDRLEGNLRKRLNERRVRESEEGWRGRVVPRLADAAGLCFARPWPVGGADLDVLDIVGVAEDGRPVAGAARSRLGLASLGPILDAALALDASLPLLVADAAPPVRLEPVRLLLAAEECDPALESVLAQLALEVIRLDVRGGASEVPVVVARGMSAPPIASPPRAASPRATTPEAAAPAEERPTPRDEPRQGQGQGQGSGSGRGGRRRGRGRRPSRAAAAPEAEDGGKPAAYEEISLFDLEDDTRSGAESRGDSGGRSRRRRGRRRSPGSGEGGGGDSDRASPAGARRRGRGGRGRADPGDAGSDDDADDDGEALVPLSPDAPDLDEDVESTYDEGELEEQPLSQGERLRLERERRRLARVAKSGPLTPGSDPEEFEAEELSGSASEEAPRLPRGRAAIVAHADADSLAAAVVLARELRQLEGLWTYPQEELMTFFRSVCTDLRENTPIYVVGFTASPARDVIQAAALYRDRLVWFDHHEWPPEDVLALRDAIGAPMLNLAQGSGTSLPSVLAQCTRRSRFTDKVVDLITGRFTQHDFERWGRVWWSRLAELAKQPGEHRAKLEPLLHGRPSDLAKEAATAPLPPPPDEVGYVASRDFRLVHFGGFVLAVADIPAQLNLPLASRVIRERYEANLSLSRTEGADVFVLGADEASGRRGTDVGAMLDHLDNKFSWVAALPGEDHVARFRLEGIGALPERLEEVIAEIAMGRALLEG